MFDILGEIILAIFIRGLLIGGAVVGLIWLLVWLFS